MAATTFYLCAFRGSLDELQREVRTHFESYSQINATAALRLPYLQAVISEGLRLYPPGSQGFPRISPGAMVDGVWVPSGVCQFVDHDIGASDETEKADGECSGRSLYECMDRHP